MTRAAPRIDVRLQAALKRLDRTDRPIAETHRALGEVADALELPRPSYEQARVLVHLLRLGRRDPGVGEVLLDIAFRVRPPEALIQALAGTAPPRRERGDRR